MTRKTRKELEKELEDIETDTGEESESFRVQIYDPGTDEYYAPDDPFGEPLDDDEIIAREEEALTVDFTEIDT